MNVNIPVAYCPFTISKDNTDICCICWDSLAHGEVIAHNKAASLTKLMPYLSFIVNNALLSRSMTHPIHKECIRNSIGIGFSLSLLSSKLIKEEITDITLSKIGLATFALYSAYICYSLCGTGKIQVEGAKR